MRNYTPPSRRFTEVMAMHLDAEHNKIRPGLVRNHGFITTEDAATMRKQADASVVRLSQFLTLIKR